MTAGSVFTIDSRDPADFGSYEVTITATTIPTPAIQGSLTASVNISVNLICRIETFVALGAVDDLLHNEKG